MSKLSKLQVNQILSKFISESPNIELTENQIEDTQILYDRLMNEKVNQTKNAWEQEALVTDIATGLSYGEDKDLIFREHSDNKHLNYFDTFLGKGEAEKILQALNEYGISTDVLKGIKKNVPDDHTIDGVRIVQVISDDPNESPHIIDFEIYKNGKLIYKWTPNKPWEEIDEEYDIEAHYNYLKEQEALKPEPLTKSGKQRKSSYIATIVSSEGEKVTAEKLSNGQIVYRGSNGRFTKK